MLIEDQIDKLIKEQKENIFKLHTQLGKERESKIIDGAKERWKNKRKGKAGKLKNLDKYKNKLMILIIGTIVFTSFYSAQAYALIRENSAKDRNSISTQYDENTDFFSVDKPIDIDKYIETIKKQKLEKHNKKQKNKDKVNSTVTPIPSTNSSSTVNSSPKTNSFPIINQNTINSVPVNNQKIDSVPVIDPVVKPEKQIKNNTSTLNKPKQIKTNEDKLKNKKIKKSNKKPKKESSKENSVSTKIKIKESSSTPIKEYDATKEPEPKNGPKEVKKPEINKMILHKPMTIDEINKQLDNPTKE